MPDTLTRTRTRIMPATELVVGQVIRWRYLHKAEDDRRLVKHVRLNPRGVVYAETVDANVTDPIAQDRTRQSWVYDDGDSVTVEVDA